jgi:hypothetical protein
MGIDRSRSRLAVGLSITGLLVALSTAPARAQATSAPSSPTTVAQCKAKFKHNPKQRAACIKWVNTPGSSCEHPLVSIETSYGPTGDTSDFTVELVGYNPNPIKGELQTVEARVILHSSRVVICPKVYINDEPETDFSHLEHYFVTVGPEGGLSTAVTIPNGHINAGATARLRNPTQSSAAARVSVITDPTHHIASPRLAQTASAPKTQFQCEKKFKQASARSQCFNQLPGASCSHPLEAEKADSTSRGASRYFKITFHGEEDEVSYSYAPRKNVAICPHGAIFKVSRILTREHCERTPQGQEECSDEYDTKNIPEPTTRSGGEFTEQVTPELDGYLLVKGYYIHPPWEHRR